MSNAAQVKAIYSLLGKQGLREEKENIVSGFTGGRTSSVREMSFAEAFELINHLKGMEPNEAAMQKMKNKIISMAHEMGWRLKGTDKIDMDHVNNWCKSLSYLKKPIDEYKYKELPKLVTQFEEVYKSYLKTISK